MSTVSSSLSSSKKSSLSSSRPDFRPIHSEIVRRTLRINFLEATSLPVNVPLHKSKEASQPSTPMREEYDRCAKQLPHSLATKLLPSPWSSDNLLGEKDFVKPRGMRGLARDDNLETLMFNIDL